MKEYKEHPAYKLIAELDANGVVVDYVILHNDGGGHDLAQHSKAALSAMAILAQRWEDYAARTMAEVPHLKREDFRTLYWDAGALSGSVYPVKQFFARLADDYYLSKPKVNSRSCSIPDYAEYAWAFLDPPYGNKYVVADWERLNAELFSSPENLEIYKWSTDWSNYFDAGLEWWGAHYWTVYDKQADCFVVIGASSTD